MNQTRNNSGVLFVNDRKKSEKHPDFTGKVLVDGVEYFISAWKKKSKGKNYLSLAFTVKGEKGESQSENPFDS